MTFLPSAPAAEDLERFASQLTPDEREAIMGWLNVGADVLRPYQLQGVVPPHSSAAAMASFEDSFNRALAKAIVCKGPVFRGLSASRWRPQSMDYLKSLIVWANADRALMPR